ncbi:MAG: lipopolysaccharide biosynthesis protein, partial [Roseibium sp.]|nr:lipopolysaccharide biosynthesis protein [Roseibium sp.]
MQSTALPQFLGRGGEQIAGMTQGTGSDRNAAGRMAVATFAVRVAGAALAYLSQIILARLMGAHDYGIYSVAWTVIIVLGVMA